MPENLGLGVGLGSVPIQDGGGTAPPPAENFLLQESGDQLLQEDGFSILK